MFSPNSNSPSVPSSLNHHLPSSSSEQLCYVHCNICDTVLAVHMHIFTSSLSNQFPHFYILISFKFEHWLKFNFFWGRNCRWVFRVQACLRRWQYDAATAAISSQLICEGCCYQLQHLISFSFLILSSFLLPLITISWYSLHTHTHKVSVEKFKYYMALW